MKVPRKKPVEAQSLTPKTSATSRRILNEANHDPHKTLKVSDLVLRVVTLAQALSEKPFYPYQVSLASRIVESLILHDGAMLTSLMSRQAGKTESVGAICAAIAIALPVLAKLYPDDWHLNMTDDRGTYRGFGNGVLIGIYAPKLEQAATTFERVKKAFETDTAEKVLKEANLNAEVSNGNAYVLSNGSKVVCQSASEQSKIEGATHHLLIAEEAQDIGDMKMRKSLHPMVAATLGTIVKIGTSSVRKCDFYNAIQENKRAEMLNGVRNHFFFPYTVCQKYNSLYRKYIAQEKVRLGEHSDEFRMSYGCFVGDTAVLRPDGTEFAISDAKVGDEVLSHTGETRLVTYKQSMGKRTTIRLSFYGAEDVICTPDHLFWTEKGWTRADKLTPENRLMVPIPKREVTSWSVPILKSRGVKRNGCAHEIPDELPLSAELGELLGWYVAEGFCNQQNRSNVQFALSSSEVAECSRIVHLLKTVFGLDAKTVPSDPCLFVEVNSTDLNRWLTRLFGHKAPNKRVPAWFFRAPEPFVASFIRALWDGDGGYSTSSRSGMFTTSSRVLWRQLDLLLRQFGILASTHSHDRGDSVIDGRVVSGGRMYQLWVYGLCGRDVLTRRMTRRQARARSLGYMLRRFKCATPAGKQEVWDIEVEKDHSFCLPSAAVHNCEWIFERGMFITPEVLFRNATAICHGVFSESHVHNVPYNLRHLALVAGIDWGSSHDSTVLTLAAVDWNNPIESGTLGLGETETHYTHYKKHILGWVEFIGDNYEYQYGEIMRLLLSLKQLRKVVTDSNTCGKPIYDRLEAAFYNYDVEVVPFNFQAKLKSDGYKSFYADLWSGRVTFPAGPSVRQSRQFTRFVTQMLDLRKEYRQGLMYVSHPDEKGAHDDYPDSAMLANWGCNTPSASRMISFSATNPFI